jgi:hypothetical protein
MSANLRRCRQGIVSLISSAVLIGCTATLRNTAPTPPQHAQDLAGLWQEPADLEHRDLFHGPGGPDLAPASASYEFVSRDTSGKSPGFDVRDDRGRLWSAKLGIEAQSEVTASRVLWAVGYHQPATYYVNQWTLTGSVAGPQPAARFRLEHPHEEVTGEWSWYENPFVGTRPFGGLIVANLILNNWDWKSSNNKIYRSSAPDDVRERYVVRDLGASLGRTTQSPVLSFFRLPGGQGTKNDLEGFEAQAFVLIAADGDLEFDYQGRYGDLVRSVSAEDVLWMCALMSRLSDAQWRAAFRAGGYSEQAQARYIAKIKQKLAEGLRVTRVQF